MKDIGYSRYDEPYCEKESEFVHVDEVDEIRKAFVEIVCLLYGNGDVEDLDAEIEHLCDLLSVSKPRTALNIERKAPLFQTQMQMVNALERIANL